MLVRLVMLWAILRGKAAMVLALLRPELIARLCIADIAPVAYGHDQRQLSKAMKTVDFTTIKNRRDVRVQLGEKVGDISLMNFIFHYKIKKFTWINI